MQSDGTWELDKPKHVSIRDIRCVIASFIGKDAIEGCAKHGNDNAID